MPDSRMLPAAHACAALLKEPAMNDVEQVINGLGDAGRAITAELASIWLLIELALILLAAAAAVAIATLVRRRVDLVSLTMGWPPFLRLLARAIAANVGMFAFVGIVVLMQAAMLALTLPERSYLLGVAGKLA